MPHDPMKTPVPVIIAAALLALAGCTTGGTAQAPASGLCNADAAQRLIGQAKPTTAEATRLTGARIVLHLAPGGARTADRRPDRLAVVTDPATGRVVRATCD